MVLANARHHRNIYRIGNYNSLYSVLRKGYTVMRFSKYKAVKTIVDGFTFASKLEAKYYQIYSAMENAGMIKNLKMQTSLPFIFEEKKIFTYKPDFEFDDQDGKHHYIDVKGIETPLFRLKKKLIEAQYKIEIEIVK